MTKTVFIVCSALSAVAFALSFWFWDAVPEPMPIHWNMAGEIDGYTTRFSGLMWMPGLVLAAPGLIALLIRVDKRADKQRAVGATSLITVAALMLMIHALIIKSAVDGEISDALIWFWAGIGAFAIAMGAVMPYVKPNRVIGIRTPWSLADETNWSLTHRFGAHTFTVAGVLTIILAVALPVAYLHSSVIAVLLIGTLAPVVFSYVLHRQQKARS